MPAPLLPLIVQPAQLEARLGDPRLLVVDLSKPEHYGAAHIPGAVSLDYAGLCATQGMAKGMLPADRDLEALLSAAGLTADHHVVACDNEGCGRSSRLLWTLAAVGHRHYSLLNGGMLAWTSRNHPVTASHTPSTPARFVIERHDDSVLATIDDILDRLGKPGVCIVDCRSPAEYCGEKRLAERGGHIPGAVNFDWVNAMDQANGSCLRPTDTLRAAFTDLGITQDKEVIVYCQTHHRSAHTWVVLKSLGFPRVRGYAGSWSEWGNRSDVPVE